MPRGNKEAQKGNFYVHDSLNHVKKNIYQKRLVSSRDLGAFYHAAISGASYEYRDKD